MTMSRIALLLIPIGPATAAAAQPVTAEQAIEVQRRMATGAAAPQCAPGSEDEIVVCGRAAPNGYRVPDIPEAGERVRGEAGSGTAAMADADRCISRCPQPLRLNIIKAVPAIVNGVRRLFGD